MLFAQLLPPNFDIMSLLTNPLVIMVIVFAFPMVVQLIPGLGPALLTIVTQILNSRGYDVVKRPSSAEKVLAGLNEEKIEAMHQPGWFDPTTAAGQRYAEICARIADTKAVAATQSGPVLDLITKNPMILLLIGGVILFVMMSQMGGCNKTPTPTKTTAITIERGIG